MATSAIDKLRAGKKAKIVHPLPERCAHWGPPGASMVIATPAEVDELVKTIPPGKLATVNTVREALAKRHGTTIACPITTGIFLSIVAKAADEMEKMGARRITPWWRVIRSDGKLNDKMPGGVAQHRKRLSVEGFKIVRRGKASLVVDGFESHLAKLS